MAGIAGKPFAYLVATLLAAAGPALAGAAKVSSFSYPWRSADHALVIDAYEYNAIDWQELARDKRVVGFIGKATDGLPPPFNCSGDDAEARLCKALWKRYAITQELFNTRRAMAKALGLEWGAYHVGRPGDPIDQANHFIDFATPGPDDLIALDIEENDPAKWMSLADAEQFARHIHRRLGRFPVLYTNAATAGFIAAHRDDYPLLSRLPLWYARYQPAIGDEFPKGAWRGYALWQFSSLANCSERRCPLRIPGTPPDIDVDVAATDAAGLRKAWPFNGLVEPPETELASVPVPFMRQEALGKKDVTIRFADVRPASRIELPAGNEASGGPRDDSAAAARLMTMAENADPLAASAMAEDGAPSGP